jgi:hypothetical protein
MHDAGDEILSIVRESDFVTVSWCKFYFDNTHSHAFGHLIGNRDDRTTDRGKLHVTMHHNWYAHGIRGRQPRVRYGHVHIYNNYYNSVGSGYCIGTGYECHIRLENTHFENISTPWQEQAIGALESGGEIGWYGLKFTGCSQPTYIGNSFPVFNLPYTYVADPVDSVKQFVVAGAGNVFGILDTSKVISVSVTSPSDNEVFEPGDTILLEAEASATEGSIDSVQFFRDYVLIGVSRTPPFSFSWENVPAGSYKITAKAIDNEGKSTFSDMVNIAVGAVNVNAHEIKSFVLYPNPVSSVLTLQWGDDLLDDACLTVYDSHGRSLIQETVRGREHSIELSHIPEGIYIVSFASKQGNIVRRFVKD